MLKIDTNHNTTFIAEYPLNNNTMQNGKNKNNDKKLKNETVVLPSK